MTMDLEFFLFVSRIRKSINRHISMRNVMVMGDSPSCPHLAVFEFSNTFFLSKLTDICDKHVS